jgi:WD40 repeat protein
MSFSPDGKTLATGSSDKTIKLWKLETGKEIFTINGQKAFLHSINFSPDGKILASAGDDNSIKLWNLSDFRLESLLERSCDWVRPYLENNIDVREIDKHLCDGIGTKKQ